VIDLLRRTANLALDAALPAECVGCRSEGPPLCAACVPALDRRLDAPAGVPIGLPGDLPAPLLQLDWCAPFSGPVRAALHAIKYGGEQRLAEPLGAAIARRWARVGVGANLVTHVPVHAARARTRGYDQAELIARATARHLGLPYAPLLARERATIAQFDLDRPDRAANVAGAFAVRPAGRPAGAATNLASRWVLLVDDVVTTGATLAACADALERAGAIGTSAITVARER
jgi:predicted amidophosphoribosyltransferase